MDESGGISSALSLALICGNAVCNLLFISNVLIGNRFSGYAPFLPILLVFLAFILSLALWISAAALKVCLVINIMVLWLTF